jgi:YfiH family protein
MNISKEDSPEILRCNEKMDLEGMEYGFFTRNGGVSTQPYESLNVGPGSADERENVLENRRRAMKKFANLDDSALATLHQIHSTRVVTVTKPFLVDQRPEGDAMVTTTSGVVLGILTADCGPVLFSDEKARVIGAAHAGWKGAAGGVLENTIQAMEALGADRKNIVAFLGPCIHQSSYEVGEEFYQAFVNQHTHNAAFFTASKRQHHFQFDLPGFILQRLANSKIKDSYQLKLDTCAEAGMFFSYRRNTLQQVKDYGRGLSAIMIK